MVVPTVSSGAESGAIDQMLHKIALFYDEEVEATTEALIALYVPIFRVFERIA
jgi:type IV pilus assembly protein PilC